MVLDYSSFGVWNKPIINFLIIWCLQYMERFLLDTKKIILAALLYGKIISTSIVQSGSRYSDRIQIWAYCMSKKSWTISYGNLLWKVGQDFLDIQYLIPGSNPWRFQLKMQVQEVLSQFVCIVSTTSWTICKRSGSRCPNIETLQPHCTALKSCWK